MFPTQDSFARFPHAVMFNGNSFSFVSTFMNISLFIYCFMADRHVIFNIEHYKYSPIDICTYIVWHIFVCILL